MGGKEAVTRCDKGATPTCTSVAARKSRLNNTNVCVVNIEKLFARMRLAVPQGAVKRPAHSRQAYHAKHDATSHGATSTYWQLRCGNAQEQDLRMELVGQIGIQSDALGALVLLPRVQHQRVEVQSHRPNVEENCQNHDALGGLDRGH